LESRSARTPLVVFGGLVILLIGIGSLIAGLQPALAGGSPNGPDTALGALMVVIGGFLAWVGAVV
jgi:hypothetical protein